MNNYQKLITWVVGGNVGNIKIIGVGVVANVGGVGVVRNVSVLVYFGVGVT